MQKRIAELEGRIVRIVDTISDGTASTALRQRFVELEEQRDRLGLELKNVGTTPRLPELPPNLTELYRSQVANLEAKLSRHPAERAAATQLLRSLIDGIEARAGETKRETIIEVTGSIAGILEVTLGPGQASSNQSVGMVVPRGGIEPPTP